MSGPRISSFCSGGDCVQVERIGDVIAVRESHNGRPGPRQLLFSLAEWETFLAGAAAGEFDPEALR
jgi:Domain of unknown function (DUF397)